MELTAHQFMSRTESSLLGAVCMIAAIEFQSTPPVEGATPNRLKRSDTMAPIDAIAQPFIRRNYRTPYIDKAIERDRKRREANRRKRKEAHHEVLPDHG